MADFLARYHGATAEEIQKHLYLLEGEEAVRHSFRVAASLDSMVLGEPQILGQVKDAYEAAEQAGSLGSVLNGLHDPLVRRRQAGPHRDGDRQQRGLARRTSRSSSRRKIFGDAHGRSVLLVGAGKMSRAGGAPPGAARRRADPRREPHLRAAEQLAEELGGPPAPFEALRRRARRAPTS